jgi:putative transposon-encoded protein
VLHHRNIYIYMYIIIYMSKKPLRSINLENGKLELKDEFELIFERTITKFGNGAKIDAPKDLLGRKVYVILRK